MSMPRRPLGDAGIEVSQLCLGSMTWGTQNSAAEAFEQIDYALDQGVNFIDTAEMYPTTPLSSDTQGRTEEIIGQWFARTGRRAEVILATKVTGAGPDWIQGGRAIDRQKILAAVDGSLRRLQSDYIDLYQLHWPNRGSYHFRQSWTYNPASQPEKAVIEANLLEVLRTLQELVDAGKIRQIGLSNETAWGTLGYLRLAAEHGLPRMVSVQNEYSLLNRLFDLDMAELAHHEQVGLLAFSPLAAGLLSGKYADGQVPAGSRRTLNDTLSGRYSEHSRPALDAYLALAEQHALDPAQMALAFCMTRPFMTSVIIGATSMPQLRNNLDAARLTLDEALLQGIADIHRRYPIPM